MSESTATLARRLAASPEARAVPCLTVQGGTSHGCVLRLEEPGYAYRVGRSTTCHLVVADDDMSREHAEIERRWDGVFVRDLASKNGVLLQGERLSGEKRLADGDELLLGRTRFLFDDPNDRLLQQVQEGALPTPFSGVETATTHTAPRVRSEVVHASPKPRPQGGAGSLVLLIIAVVVLLGTVGLAISFLLTR